MTTKCRNLECVSGRTPGLRVVGAGNARNPVLGQKIYWDWVPCPACSDDPKVKATYKHVTRSESERRERAEWATAKKPYKPQQQPLARIHDRNAHAAPPKDTNESVQLAQLAQQLAKLTQQVTELLEENRQLRKQLAERVKPTQAEEDMIAFGSSAKPQ